MISIGADSRKLKIIISHKYFLPIVVALAIVTIMSMVLWVSLPGLLHSQLSSQLLKRGFELKVFTEPRLAGWRVYVDQLDIESDSLSIKTTGLRFDLLDGYQVAAEKVQLSTKAIGKGPRDFARREVLLATFKQVVDQMSFNLNVDKLEICRPECIRLGLILKPGLSGSTVQLTHQNGSVTGVISQDNLAFELVIPSNPSLLLSLKSDISNAQRISFSLEADIRNKSLPAISGRDGDLQYSGLLRDLNIIIEGGMPSSGPSTLEVLRKEIDVAVSLTATAEGQISYLDLALKSQFEPTTLVSLFLNKGVFQANILNGLSVDVVHPSLDDTSLSFPDLIRCNYGAELHCETEVVQILSDLSRLSDTNKPNLRKRSSAAKLPNKVNRNLKATLSHPTFHLKNEDWIFLSSLQAEVLEGEDESVLMTLEMDKLQIDQENILFNQGIASVFGVGNIHLEMNHNFKNTLGSLRVKLMSPLDQLVGAAEYFKIDDLQIFRGSILLNSELQWGSLELTQVDISLFMNDIDASYQGYKIEGGNVSSTLSGWPLITSAMSSKADSRVTASHQQVSRISAEKIDIGVLLEEVNMTFYPVLDVVAQKLSIEGEHVQGTLFGGAIQSEDFLFSYEIPVAEGEEKLNGQFDLTVEAVSLKEILALEREDVEGSGFISGSVPVQIKNGKLSIADGVMAAREPGGVIKYKPNSSVIASVKGNSSLELIVNVMSDFRYDSLDIALNYSPEGIMIANTSLKGRNPVFENGREIHFNLNLEENVLTLLKSLRLSSELAESLKLKGER